MTITATATVSTSPRPIRLGPGNTVVVARYQDGTPCTDQRVVAAAVPDLVGPWTYSTTAGCSPLCGCSPGWVLPLQTPPVTYLVTLL